MDLESSGTMRCTGRRSLTAVTFALALCSPTWAGQQIVTVAGGPGRGPATGVQQSTSGLLVSGSSLYVSDAIWNVVRRVDLTTGQEDVVAGIGEHIGGGYGGDGGAATAARLYWPAGLTLEGDNLVFTERQNNRVRLVDTTTGLISTVAGNGNAGTGGDGGPAIAAELADPTDIVSNGPSLGYVVVDSATNRLRYIDGNGIITTLLIGGVTLDHPIGLAIGPSGWVVTSYFGNEVGTFVPFMPIVFPFDFPFVIYQRIAGNGASTYNGDGILGTSASVFGPWDVTEDASGNYFISDLLHYRVRRVDHASGLISTVAGNGTRGVGVDGIAATSSQLTDATGGLAVGSAGEIYIGDGSRVRRVAGGIIQTVAGNDYLPAPGDGRPAFDAQLQSPTSVADDASGNIFIADGDRVRRVDATSGVITTYAGGGVGGAGGPATAASLAEADAVAVDAAGNVYIADDVRIRKVDAAGIIHPFAGGGSSTAEGVPATSAQFDGPLGLAVDGTGDVYIVYTQNSVVRRVDHVTGLITTIAGSSGAGFGGDNGPAVSALLKDPVAAAVDAAGRLFIADTDNNCIRLVSGGTITTYAGLTSATAGAGFEGDGGPAVAARLDNPTGVALDAAGNLYIADHYNDRIRRVDAVSHVITTWAGGGSAYPGDGGLASAASLRLPEAVAVDPLGRVLIADQMLARIRRIQGICGDTLPDPGEQCDDGAGNGTPGSCCDATCHLRPGGESGYVCRPAAVNALCDVSERCDGTNPTCPPDGSAAAGTACRPSANGDACDPQENCTGTSSLCPTDVRLTGTACAGDPNPCTADVCADGVCTHPAGNAGVVCNPGNGECDPPDTCDGTHITCPVVRAPTGAPCALDGNPCTTDACNGATGLCEHTVPNVPNTSTPVTCDATKSNEARVGGPTKDCVGGSLVFDASHNPVACTLTSAAADITIPFSALPTATNINVVAQAPGQSCTGVFPLASGTGPSNARIASCTVFFPDGPIFPSSNSGVTVGFKWTQTGTSGCQVAGFGAGIPPSAGNLKVFDENFQSITGSFDCGYASPTNQKCPTESVLPPSGAYACETGFCSDAVCRPQAHVWEVHNVAHFSHHALGLECGGTAGTRPLLKIQKVTALPGQQSVSLSRQEIHPASPGTFDPVTQGVEVSLFDVTGSVFTALAEPGAFDPVTRHGWVANPAHGKWVYKNPHGAGLKTLTVTDVSGDGSRTRLKLTAKTAKLALAVTANPLSHQPYVEAQFYLPGEGRCFWFAVPSTGCNVNRGNLVCQ